MEKLNIQKDTVYVHFAKPLGPLNFFQKIIQKVQGKMGWTKWETTHVFVTYNEQIIDRTGIKTVATQKEALKYLEDNYDGYMIDSFGIKDTVLASNFTDLYKFISLKKTFFFEDEFGEVYGQTTYSPNNTVYGLGKETALTVRDTFNLWKKDQKISEQDAIAKAEQELGLTSGKFLPADKLKNPTYCSLTIGGLIPALNGLTILRYPALSHAFLFNNYKHYGISYMQTIIKKQ